MGTSITKTKLSNGLSVSLKEIHNAPLVSNWLWYRVGSKDEVTGLTGVSHWTEHMQFKGTTKYPSAVLDRVISREGGYWNAFTFLDWTTYFETMPADKIDLVLQLEADRMRNSLFDPEEVESERTVIISERQGSENEPLFKLGEEVQAASYRVHPYHHSIIGDMADLETISRDDLYNHYCTHYVPDNAVLAIAGDFKTEDMLSRIQELFEPIPCGDERSRLDRAEPPPPGEKSLTVEGPGETTFVQVDYQAPAGGDPDFFSCVVLDSLLTGPSSLNMFGGGISNKTSRLYRALVDNELAVSVSGGLPATKDPFMYTIILTVHPQKSAHDVTAVLEDEIKRLQDAPPPEVEVARAMKQARALFAYGSESISNQAFWMGYSEMFATYDWFEGYLDKLSAVTPQDVQHMAQTYLRPQNRVLGIYLPTGFNQVPS